MFVHNSRRHHTSSSGKHTLSSITTNKRKSLAIQNENAPQQPSQILSTAMAEQSTLSAITQFDANLSPKSCEAEKTTRSLYARALGIDPSQRILCFKPSAPYPRINIKVNTQQPTLKTHASHIKRHVSTLPEKRLDAPYLADDFYQNVLDWSKSNVLAVALDKAVYLWNANNGDIQALSYNDNDQVASLGWSDDGSFLALGTSDGYTQIWDVQANKKVRTMTGQDCRIGVLAWNRSSVTTGAYNGVILSHDVRMEDHYVRELRGHAAEVCGLKYRWDGVLASGGNDNVVNVWDSRSSSPRFQKRKHEGAVKALAWCPWQHNTLASGGGRDDQNIHFWNASSGVRLNTIHTNSQVTSLTWSHHYEEIASTHGYPHNQISLWSYPSLNKIIDIPAHDSRILHSALSPDGQVLATGAADQNLKFWRIFDANGQSRLTPQRIAQKGRQLRVSKSLR